ncbi:MAG: hypothetical protein E7663_04705 [Ruminococcaceae bacterium]|nr:hypothetical protein [Oscillospiraceae bacterium]
MTKKSKARLLNIIGAVISFVAPAVAAIVEFPHVKETVSPVGGKSLADILNISGAALVIVAVLFLLTCWRFCAHRMRLPRSGLILSAILFVIAHGVELVIHSFKVIMFWSMLGCGGAAVLYFIADRIKEEVD